jgi:hypothetical protein
MTDSPARQRDAATPPSLEGFDRLVDVSRSLPQLAEALTRLSAVLRLAGSTSKEAG